MLKTILLRLAKNTNQINGALRITCPKEERRASVSEAESVFFTSGSRYSSNEGLFYMVQLLLSCAVVRLFSANIVCFGSENESSTSTDFEASKTHISKYYGSRT